MESLATTIQQRLLPAFESGDETQLAAVARELFAPDVRWLQWGFENRGRERLLDEWLVELRAWSPQRYRIENPIDAGDAAAFDCFWSGTHAGPLLLPTGDTVEPTGRSFERRSLIQAWRGADGRIVKWHFHSAYPEVIAELGGLDAGQVNVLLEETIAGEREEIVPFYPDAPPPRTPIAKTYSRMTEMWHDIWYPAWDHADSTEEYFIEMTQRVWHPDAKIGRHDEEDSRLVDLMPVLIDEWHTWRPQRHVMINVIDNGGEWVSFQYHWEARYSGKGKTRDGGELPDEKRSYAHRAGVIVRWDGLQTMWGRGYASFSSHEDEMGLLGEQ